MFAKKILIVEDEELIAKPLALKLRSADFDVTHAEDGLVALDLLEVHNFDLILLDLLMPRMDGFEFLAELNERKIKTPVIVSTNLDRAEDIKRVCDLGCNSYYIKSDTTLDEIVQNIKIVLADKKPACHVCVKEKPVVNNPL